MIAHILCLLFGFDSVLRRFILNDGNVVEYFCIVRVVFECPKCCCVPDNLLVVSDSTNQPLIMQAIKCVVVGDGAVGKDLPLHVF